MVHLQDFIEQHTSYPYELIQSNVDRLGPAKRFLGQAARCTVLVASSAATQAVSVCLSSGLRARPSANLRNLAGCGGVRALGHGYGIVSEQSYDGLILIDEPQRCDGLPLNPPISVCIPMYNNSATIERCLRSILDQAGVDFEIVVVDDDSSDESAAIAATMLRPGRPAHTQCVSRRPQPKPQQMSGIRTRRVHPVRSRRRLVAPGRPAVTCPMFRRSDCRNGLRAPPCDD